MNTTPDEEAGFEVFGLNPKLRDELRRAEYVSPTPVQKACFEPIADGKDVIAQARTGTGKTAAFVLPLVNSRLREDGGPTALILTPTRELAMQVGEEFARFGKPLGIHTTTLCGGMPFEPQLKALKREPRAIIGTPGRVLDHLTRGTLQLPAPACVILDEADEMLSMGFARELTAIIERLPSPRQTLLFSATIDDDVKGLADKYTTDAVMVALSGDAVGAAGIRHSYYPVTGSDKAGALLQVLEQEGPESAIVFCNTKAATERLWKRLNASGLKAAMISGDLSQKERQRSLESTREQHVSLLVATDVAARGIDISHLTHVINFDFPEKAESYVHRTGRTGRAGRTGHAISLVTPRDLAALYMLRLRYKIFPSECRLPAERELDTRRELDELHVLDRAFEDHADDSSRAVARRLLSHPDAERIVSGLVEAFLGAAATGAADALPS